MKTLLEKAALSAVRAFGAAVIVLAPGILSAPDMHGALLLATAAVLAGLTGAVRAIQGFVPEISFSSLIGDEYGKYVDSFVRAFLGTFLTLVLGVLAAPDFTTAKSLGIAALTGAFAAGLRALQAFFTKGENPAPNVGVVVNPK